jgi:hypothetical protein
MTTAQGILFYSLGLSIILELAFIASYLNDVVEELRKLGDK